MEDRELLAELARRLTSSASVSGHTVGSIWLAYKATLPRGRSFQMRRHLLGRFVVFFWRRPAASLLPADWEDYRRSRKKRKTRLGRAPCELSLNLELARAKQMLTWAVDAGKLVSNPFRRVRAVKTRTRRESWFTAEQIGRLYDAGYGLRWDHQQRAFRALVAVMADTGLRISEALQLRWDRITLRGTTSVVGKGKKQRVIAFTPRAFEALGKLDRHGFDPRVFLNWKSGKPYNGSTVRAWFRQAIAIAKLEGVKADGDLGLVPHVLRHSFASIADERGAPPSWIQAALGHSHASTTAVYLHRNEADAAIRMAAIMSGRKPPRRAVHEFAEQPVKEIVKLIG